MQKLFWLALIFIVTCSGCTWFGLDPLVSVSEPFRSVLRQNKVLLETGGAFHVSEQNNKKIILVAVGRAVIENGTVQHKANAVNIARNYAMKEILTYSKGVKIVSIETTTELGKDENINGIDNGSITTLWSHLYEAKSSGHLFQPPTVGSWQTNEGTIQIVVLGIVLDSLKQVEINKGF